MNMDEQLERVGHARVMVVLKPRKTHNLDGRRQLALSETISLQQGAAESLQKHFKSFKNSRASLLAKDLDALLKKRGQTREFVVEDKAAVVPPTSAIQYYPNLGVMLGTVDKGGLAALRSDEKLVGDVCAAPDFSMIRPVEDAALSGPEIGPSWALRRLKVPELWDKGHDGAGVLIGHLDTGVDRTHPALAPDTVDAFAEFDFLGHKMANAVSRDTRFHGTHTAGILCGKPVDGAVFGVAPGARLASAIVIEGGDVPARVIGALDWCVGQQVRVVNVSLGVLNYDEQFSTILRLLRQRNILPVVAIGNEGPQTSRSPGNLAESLSVGAIDEMDEIWLGSSSDIIPGTPKRSVPMIIAPGASIYSSVPGGLLRPLTGTSMAAPHVAGLAALLMSAKPEASVAQIEAAILASCKRPPSISTLRGNKGVPDAVEALKAL
jgi:subtilisin family serine protease